MDRLFRESLELFGTTSTESQADTSEEKLPKPVEPPRGARSFPAEQPAAGQAAPSPLPQRSTAQFDPHPGLKKLLTRFTDLPAQSAVLGVSDDGLPVLLDLYDPSPGSLLVMGDEREAQLGLLRTIVASTASRNSPRGVQFLIISHQPDSWKAWTAEHGYSRHCLAIAGVEEDITREWVLRLADWTEQRRLGQRSGPPVLLLMDSLSFLQRLTYDVRLNFDWMAKEGPPAQIWSIAAISVDLVESLGPRMLRGFAGKIIGFAREPEKAARLTGLPAEEASRFTTRGRFAVQAGEGWLSFGLPGQVSA